MVAFSVVVVSKLQRWPDISPPVEQPSLPPAPPVHSRGPAAAARAAEVIAKIDALLATVGHRTIESRSAATETVDVDRSARIVTVLCVPYEQPTSVPFRGGTWTETFARGAFNGITMQRHTIRVNRDHDRTKTVGKVISLDADNPQGLVGVIRIARTPLGDETLALAGDDCLSASVGFGVPAGGEQLDHRARTRRITHVVLDHVSLVSDPAYAAANVLAVG